MRPELVDIGANLGHKSFADDLPDVLASAREAGVGRIVVTGTSVAGSEAACALAKDHGGLWSTAGVHPHHAGDWDDGFADALRALAAETSVVALGECGLDYERNYSSPQDQRRCFEAQLQLAVEMQVPVFLHARRAAADLTAMVAEYRRELTAAVVHCFTGEAAELEGYLELDLHIGITGWICDERRGTHLHPLMREIPPNRLMVETDAPYLLPRSIEPKPKTRRNEPANLPWVVETIAACVGKPPAVVAAETTATAVEFFGL